MYIQAPQLPSIERRFYFMTDNEKRAHDMTMLLLPIFQKDLFDKSKSDAYDADCITEAYVHIFNDFYTRFNKIIKK